MRRFLISLLLFALLATATGVLWRHRFEHAGPPLSEPFKPGLPGWKWLEGSGRERNPDATGALILSKQKGDPPITVERVLGKLEGARFLHVQADARWTDVKEQNNVLWATARGLICGKRPDGTNTWPKDHWLINAYGSSDWHREESVFDLVPDIGEARFALQHLGEQGALEVRNVEIQVVRQRGWYVPAAAVLTGLWVLWAAWTLAPALPLTFRLRPIRSLLGGAAVIAASWLLVFPQPRFCARPLVGGFALGQPIPAPVPPPPPAPMPVPPPQAPTPPITPPTVSVLPTPPVQAPPSSTPQVPPVVEKREARVMEQEIRKLDERFNFLHLLAFTAFGLALFSTTHLRTWPMAATVALASEALPNWQLEQAWDLGDLGDLAADFSGLALAALAVTLVKRLWRTRVSRSTDPGTSVSPAPP